MRASISLQQDGTSSSEVLAPAVRLRRIAKSFGATRALDGVDLDLSSGEAHGLIGENGAGKSTLMRILAGFFSDYGGQIAIEGQAVRLTSPAQARGRGVALVHQELSLLPELTVAENILLGREPRGTVPAMSFSRARAIWPAIGSAAAEASGGGSNSRDKRYLLIVRVIHIVDNQLGISRHYPSGAKLQSRRSV